MRPLGLARADGELEGYGAVRRERCKKITARWVGGGTRKPRPGGWAMVQEHHDLAGGRWCAARWVRDTARVPKPARRFGSMQATVAENCYRVSSGENTTSGRGNGAGKPQWVAE